MQQSYIPSQVLFVVWLICLLGRGVWAVESEPVKFELGKQIANVATVSISDGAQENRVEIPYLLYVPKSYGAEPDGKPKKASPLLLFLHGLGECGNGNLDLVKKHGPPKIVEHDDDFPFIVVSPQCPPKEFSDVPTAWQPDPLIKLLDHVSALLNVDKRRTYVTGLSMGGFGTWRLIGAYPQRFAAAIPICGGGDSATAASIAKLSVWSFHGQDDEVVPLRHSEQMVQAVKESGGDIQLTVYSEVGHDSWTRTYENAEVFRWLLTHVRDN